jgi:hypothetical protein
MLQVGLSFPEYALMPQKHKLMKIGMEMFISASNLDNLKKWREEQIAGLC